MGNDVVAALSHENGHGLGKDPAAASDDVVIDRDPAGIARRLGVFRLADSHAAGAEIVKQTVLEVNVATAAPEPDSKATDVSNLAIGDSDLAGIVDHDRGVDIASCLRRIDSVSGREPLAVLE